MQQGILQSESDYKRVEWMRQLGTNSYQTGPPRVIMFLCVGLRQGSIQIKGGRNEDSSSKEGQPCSGRKKVCTLITLGDSGAWLTSVLQTWLVFRKTATLCGHHVQFSVNAGPEA